MLWVAQPTVDGASGPKSWASRTLVSCYLVQFSLVRFQVLMLPVFLSALVEVPTDDPYWSIMSQQPQILLPSARHLEKGRGTTILEVPRLENCIGTLCPSPLGSPPPPPHTHTQIE